MLVGLIIFLFIIICPIICYFLDLVRYISSVFSAANKDTGSASPCLYAGDIFPLKYFLTKDNGNSVLIENPEFMIAVLKRVTAMNAELRAQNNTLVEQSNAQTVRRLIRR